MHLVVLILCIIGIVLFILAIFTVNEKAALPLGILSIIFLMGSLIEQCHIKNFNKKEHPHEIILIFAEDYSQHPSTTVVKIVSTTSIREMPDGCFVYSVILVDQDSMYTYSAVLDPENIEVVNFILEESIPRLENHQNKK